MDMIGSKVFQTAVQYACRSKLDAILRSSVPEQNAEELIFYPNPADGKVTVSNIAGPAQFTITDLSGKLVQTAELNGQNSSVDLSGLPSGSYYIREIASGRTYSIIKKINIILLRRLPFLVAFFV